MATRQCNSLPVELLFRIWNDPTLSENTCSSSTSIVLASVCRQWRSVALATPQLWTKIHLRESRLSDLEQIIHNELNRIRIVKMRSQGLPLTLTIDSVSHERSEPLTRYLVKHLDRIEHLTVVWEVWEELAREVLFLMEGNHRVVKLAGLKRWNIITAKMSYSGTYIDAPNLAHLSIRSDEGFDIRHFDRSLHLRHVELYLARLTRSELDTLLSLAELESITLRVIRSDFILDGNFNHTHYGTLASLRYLKANELHFLKLFSKIAPNLQHLEVTQCRSTDHTRAIPSLNSITSNTVTKLVLHVGGSRFSLSLFQYLLAKSPLIEHLGFVHQPVNELQLSVNASNLLQIIAKPELCSRLSTLQLQRITCEVQVLTTVVEKMDVNFGISDTPRVTIVDGDEVQIASLRLCKFPISYITTSSRSWMLGLA